MATCVKCGRKYKQNWVRPTKTIRVQKQPCPQCRGRAPMPERSIDSDIKDHQRFKDALMGVCRMDHPSIEKLLRSHGYGYEADAVQNLVTCGRVYLGIQDEE